MTKFVKERRERGSVYVCVCVCILLVVETTSLGGWWPSLPAKPVQGWVGDGTVLRNVSWNVFEIGSGNRIHAMQRCHSFSSSSLSFTDIWFVSRYSMLPMEILGSVNFFLMHNKTQMVAFVVCCLAILASTLLFWFHFYLALTDTTTFEFIKARALKYLQPFVCRFIVCVSV